MGVLRYHQHGHTRALTAGTDVADVGRVITQLRVVLAVRLRVDEQREVAQEEELHLQRVDFTARHTTHLGVVGVVEVLVVKELGRQHDAGDE